MPFLANIESCPKFLEYALNIIWLFELLSDSRDNLCIVFMILIPWFSWNVSTSLKPFHALFFSADENITQSPQYTASSEILQQAKLL